MNPDPTPTDPDIVPLTDTRDDCSSTHIYVLVGFDADLYDALFDWPWSDPPDGIDTNGDPE